jgi:hypothetical protein
MGREVGNTGRIHYLLRSGQNHRGSRRYGRYR